MTDTLLRKRTAMLMMNRVDYPEEHMTAKTLICGIYADDYVVILEEAKARELEQVWRALDTARTWADVKEIMPEAYFRNLWETLEDRAEEGDSLPELSDAFDPVAVPGFADGDWPDWPAASMLDWMPATIRQRYGQRAETALNGDFLEIAPEHIVPVMQELSELGYTCVRDDELIARVCGQGQWPAADA